MNVVYVLFCRDSVSGWWWIEVEMKIVKIMNLFYCLLVVGIWENVFKELIFWYGC